MARTNRSKTLRFAISLFAITVALLFPFQGHAQGPDSVKSLFNLGTGSALGNLGQKGDGAILYSYPFSGSSQQKWQFVASPDADLRDPLDPSSIRTRISSMSSFLQVDVAGHTSAAAYIVQATKIWVDNYHPWRYQTWKVTGPLFFIRDSSGNSLGVYTIRNGQSGLCLTEEGWGPGGGANPVVQRACDIPNTGGRQLWYVFKWDSMVWETASTMNFTAWQ